ncbi:MAG: tRNA uridine-5-carboxymethylaminomethyl(34) synthesis GTPase MnmE [Bdellovibrionales bacterium]|nr:tRNA uridine-5-carboxymethylaminomethyl(34) synthesis GTPase MnmE [Bdellovibrionales bacterium]
MVEFSGYLAQDTIVARITGAGGAISGIRLSGPSSMELLTTLCFGVSNFKPRELKLVRLVARDGRTLDESTAVFFRAPNSFTGEDTVEIFMHGGSLIVNSVIAELLDLGARQALPGEFSFRAVRNGKLTVDQAQAVHDLVSASNSVAHELALERLSGSQSRAFSEIADQLRSTIALTEAGIDFSDQDLDELDLQKLKLRVLPALQNLRKISSSIDRGRRIQEGISVVLAGLPNAGKSSLFNEILGQDRSITSDEAGTTRDIVRESVRLRASNHADEATFILHDTAGLRETAGKVERTGVELTRGAVASADIVTFVLEPGSSKDLVLQEWRSLGEPGEKSLLVLNKVDLIGGPDGKVCNQELEEWKQALSIKRAVAVSSRGQVGIEALVGAFVELAKVWVDRAPTETVLTRQDQVDAVNQAATAVQRAQSAKTHDIFAADLRQALEKLTFFIGSTSVDDVLGRIFSQFCIGK